LNISASPTASVSSTVSSATVELAAVAVGVEGARIAKSMSFKLADDAPIIIVTAGDRKIDNAKVQGVFPRESKDS